MLTHVKTIITLSIISWALLSGSDHSGSSSALSPQPHTRQDKGTEFDLDKGTGRQGDKETQQWPYSPAPNRTSFTLTKSREFAPCLLASLSPQLLVTHILNFPYPGAYGPQPSALQSPQPQTLSPGQKHTYPLTLKANDFLNLVVEQKGIDVVVRLVGPDGTVMVEVDSPNGTQGPEPILFVAEIAGTYQLEVESLDKSVQPGKYELKLEPVRPASEQDKAEIEIEKLNDTVEQLYREGKYDQAIIVAQQGVDKAEQHLGTDHLGLAVCLNNLALLYYHKGNYAHVEPLYQRALAIYEKALGPDHQFVAQSLNNLAGLYQTKDEYSKAVPLYHRALAILEKTSGPDHLEVARTLNNLALLHQETGEFTKAEPLYQRSLEIRKKALGPDHPMVATSFNNVALLHRLKGDFIKAEPLFQRALAIREKTLGPDHPAVAISLNNLAFLYYNKGDYGKAEPYFQRALAIREKTLGPNHPETATCLDNLASLYQDKQEFSKAEPLSQRALVIREQALGSDHLSVAYSLNNLASLYFDIGDFSKAELFNERALAIREKALGPDHPEVASSLNNLAGLYRALGNLSKAEQLYQRALAIREKTLGPDHPDVASSLSQLAGLYQAKGNIAQAIEFLTRCNTSTEHDLVHNLAAGSENQKLLYLKQTSHHTDLTISLNLQAAPQNQAATQAALTVILRRKGRTLDVQTSAIAVLRNQQHPETQKLLDDYASLASQISALTLRGPGKKELSHHLAYLRELEDQKEKLEAEISTRSAEFKTQVTPITLENVQALIPPEAALVEYAIYQPYDAKARKFGPTRYVAYILNPDGTIRFADLGDTRPIEETVNTFRQVVRNHVSQGRMINLRLKSRKSQPNIQVIGRKLEALVFQPVRKLLGPTRRVLLSPDGGLNLIPFDALVDDRGKYLVETFEFSYLTSGRDLLRLQTGIKSEQPPLIVANPNYAEGNGPLLLGQQFSPLLQLGGTVDEATRIKTMFPTATVFLDQQASKTVLSQAKRPELVHISTHGYFLRDIPEPASTTEEKTRRLERSEENQPLDNETLNKTNPLLRSFLFFAGANKSDSTTETNGILTALETTTLNLWGTRLVVLSACDTGLGDVKNGDGVYGLRRALVLAGSESQMVSLWPVSDAGTRDLMIRYYQLLKTGVGRSTALRQVRLEFLKNPKHKHPYFWASFILSGEWANFDGKR